MSENHNGAVSTKSIVFYRSEIHHRNADVVVGPVFSAILAHPSMVLEASFSLMDPNSRQQTPVGEMPLCREQLATMQSQVEPTGAALLHGHTLGLVTTHGR